MANNGKPKKVRFRDEEGRFVAESLRYKYATVVERKVRNKWYKVTEGTKVITPKRLTELITRDEFESLDPAFGKTTTIVPTARKYTAWDVAEKMNRTRGLKGKQIRVEMNILDGKSLRKIVFWRKMKTRGNPTYGIFAQMNEVMKICKKHPISIVNQVIDNLCTYELRYASRHAAEIDASLDNL
jgi:hypothetical protein